MTSREPKSVLAYLVVFATLAGGFYSLVLYPYVLDDLVKGAIIGFMGMALNWTFGAAVAAASARDQQSATQAGITAALTPPNGALPAEEPVR